MKTLLDVLDNVRIAPSLTDYASGGRVAFKKRSRLKIAGERDLVLPSDPDGLTAVVDQSYEVEGLNGEPRIAASLELLRNPTIALPMPTPSQEQLTELGMNPGSFRHELPRRISTCLGLTLENSRTLYGIGKYIVVENAIRMGSSKVVQVTERWTELVDEIEEWLYEELCQAKESAVALSPEPGTRPWKTVTMLLGGPNSSGHTLPGNWKRQMQLAAGLRRVRLDVRVNPDLTRGSIVRELRTKPPNALLVWADWVSSPEAYTTPYRTASPSAIAEVLGTADSSMSFDEIRTELMLHLRLIEPIRRSRQEINDWKEFAQAVDRLRGDHFHLTDRARAMISNSNPYRYPDRMFAHLEKLAVLAYTYRASDGQISGRIADIAKSEHAIEIALFDKSLDGVSTFYDGRKLDTLPHVKVDDAKREPETCGRIYFAIDHAGLRFVVDHIGIHDYS